MFNKVSQIKNQGMQMKDTSAGGRDKDKEMFDKISRIQESYVDAAIRSVRKKFSSGRNMGFE